MGQPWVMRCHRSGVRELSASLCHQQGWGKLRSTSASSSTRSLRGSRDGSRRSGLGCRDWPKARSLWSQGLAGGEVLAVPGTCRGVPVRQPGAEAAPDQRGRHGGREGSGKGGTRKGREAGRKRGPANAGCVEAPAPAPGRPTAAGRPRGACRKQEQAGPAGYRRDKPSQSQGSERRGGRRGGHR